MHTRARRVLAFVLAALLTVGLFLIFGHPHRERSPRNAPSREPATHESRKGPPWIYGKPDARFTVTEFGDLECPYCAESFPRLRHWIDRQQEVNWQWAHFPLSDHEPEATRDARRIECVGEVQGNAAFWTALGERYLGHGAHTAPPSAISRALAECFASTRPDRVIGEQKADAMRKGVTATPTLIITDQRSGKHIALQGVPEGDGLLSALDRLAEEESP